MSTSSAGRLAALTPRPQEPPRSLGLYSAIAIVLGELIGIGIFLTPAGMAKTLDAPLLVLAVWLGMGATALCGALCYGELAARFPQAGGIYVYLREAWGRRIAFLCGWQYLLVLDPGLTAALATGVAAYVAAIVPLPAKPVAMAVILAAAAANLAGLRLAAGLGRVLAAAKVGLLLVIVGWGFGAGLGEASRFLPLAARDADAGPLLPALAGAIIAAFFSFGGWWDVSKLAAEVREPQRVVPRALAWGVAIATLVYVLTSAVFVYLVPREEVASGETFAAQAGAVLFGDRGAVVLSAIVVVCVGSSLLAFMTAAPRVYFAMARDGLGLGAFGALHPRRGVPVLAIVVQAALGCLLVLLGRFDQIIGYFIFVQVLFLAASVIGLFRLRARGGPPAYATPAWPLPAIAFLAMIVVVLVLLAAGRPRESALGVAVTALGLPVYAWQQSRKKDSPGSETDGLDQDDSVHRRR